MREQETAWILDDGNMALGTCGMRLTLVTYTDPCCIRFARAWDAENLRQSLYSHGLGEIASRVRPQEHMWEGRPDHYETIA